MNIPETEKEKLLLVAAFLVKTFVAALVIAFAGTQSPEIAVKCAAIACVSAIAGATGLKQ